MTDSDWLLRYTPCLLFDQAEPFYPVRVGCTVMEQPGPSPSFRRHIRFPTPQTRQVIEYAIYFDFDIQHLYELEHVWVYLDAQGDVVDCEASFHGSYMRGLLKDRSNLEGGTHARLYSQPGKHGFLPSIDFLELVPDLHTAPYEEAGSDGLIIARVMDGILETDTDTNRLVERYLQSLRFRPTMQFGRYDIPKDLLVPWPALLAEIPRRIADRLTELRSWSEGSAAAAAE